jgi:S-formylglutathione hydrolase FrmB
MKKVCGKGTMPKSIVNVLFSLCFFSQLNAATIDTVITFSPSMKKNIKAVVIKPDDYSSKSSFPVVYLLHGAGGDYSDWIKKVPEITKYADEYHLIIVCPNGDSTSWYFDSPIDPSMKYETYVSSELVKWIDAHYKTLKSKEGRAITGLSMGGHGALYLAFKHQDVYGAAGSMSGGVDIRAFPNNWDISKRLGKYAQFPQRWDSSSVINLTYLLIPGSLSLIIDCGVSDFFFPVNEKLHEKLLLMNIEHDFIVRPGSHSWEYWANSVQYQMLFMNNFFQKKITK